MINKKHSSTISRRDFLNGTLVGTGAVLLGGMSPAKRALAQSNIGATASESVPFDPWAGPGGIGDYVRSNGDASSMSIAHTVRDGTAPTGGECEEEVDFVVIGGGFSGLSAAYTLLKETRGNKRILLLDVHSLPGGVAKLNEFEVDGYRLMAPQASDNIYKPNWMARFTFSDEIWDELDMPSAAEFDKVVVQKPITGVDSTIKFAPEHYGMKYTMPHTATTGTFFREQSGGSYSMNKDIVANEFSNTPFPEEVQKQLAEAYDMYSKVIYADDDWEQQLDNITFKEYLEGVRGYSPLVTSFLDPMLASGGGGLGADAVSALHAFRHGMPGVIQHTQNNLGSFMSTADSILQLSKKYVQPRGFPGGNSLLIRKMVKRMLPGAIEGEDNLDDVLNKSFRPEAFDKAGNPVRMRFSSMVSGVEHEGKNSVCVSYVRNGKAYKVRAKHVVLGVGGWIGKRILKDAPRELFAAMDSYNHAPMLTINVAVRNWKFFANKGISGAQWYQGFGHFVNIRQPLALGAYDEPADPNKPAVMTMYVSLERPDSGLAAKPQAALARAEMLAWSYAGIESKTLAQLSAIFGNSGFDPERDVAGIVVNRWGHDFIVAPPGFYYGKGGGPAAPTVIRQGYGRVHIGHSELKGVQTWAGACAEGRRAALQCLESA